MESTIDMKPHAVCIPYPAQGHISPVMHLSKLLHSNGFHITFVNTEFNHKRYLRSNGPDALNGLPDFRFETVPDGLPPSDKDATQDVPALSDSIRKNCLDPFVDLIVKLNSASDVPRVSLVVPDGAMSFGIQAGKILGIPVVSFWTASACGFMAYLQYPELIKRGLTPLNDESDLRNGYLDIPIDWIPGMKNMRLKDIPSFIRTTDRDDIVLNFIMEEAQNCLNASAIIFNTFDDLEHEVLDAIISMFPNIYTIGPLQLLGKELSVENKLNSMRSSLWKEDSKCLEWLDRRDPNSVVYVNFGSITVMTDEQLREFAWGLANSKQSFLWIIRPGAVGDSAVLPEEFIRGTEDRGMLASWCGQDLVLRHPSVGAFLTHCGWNSTVETISGGVPVICWPFFAEQQTNCRYACTTWGIGVEIDGEVKRKGIEELVRELIRGEEGKKMRNKAMEWKRKAEQATKKGGSSYDNFDKLINDVI